MSQRKHCSYKGCDSNRTQANVTFFQFPREETRYNLWMKLSRCENKDAPIKYLCSKHFDERKYISRNTRRLLLLATAIPYPYVSDSEDNDDNNEAEADVREDENQVVTSKSDDEDFILQSMDVSEMADDTFRYAESTINEIEYITEEVPSKSDDHGNKKGKWSSDTETSTRAKIIAKDEATYQTEKNEITTSKISLREDEQIIDVADNHSDIIDNPNITTFIFKGEEYIQMPKRLYVEERNELIASIEYFKDIVAKIKSQIDGVKL